MVILSLSWYQYQEFRTNSFQVLWLLNGSCSSLTLMTWDTNTNICHSGCLLITLPNVLDPVALGRRRSPRSYHMPRSNCLVIGLAELLDWSKSSGSGCWICVSWILGILHTCIPYIHNSLVRFSTLAAMFMVFLGHVIKKITDAAIDFHTWEFYSYAKISQWGKMHSDNSTSQFPSHNKENLIQ